MTNTRRMTALARHLRKRDTWAEKLMWSWLRNRRFSRYKFRRQHPYGSYVLDFYCLEAQLNIELDGFGHGFPQQRAADERRDAWLQERGVRVLRFWNHRLRRDKDFIRQTIWQVLQARAPRPLPECCRPAKPPVDVPRHFDQE